MPKKNGLLRSIFSNIVNQIVPVMIGVYLGFALNNFGENRKVKRQKETFEKMLYNEISSNLENVTTSLPYHFSLKDDIDSMSRADDAFVAFDNYTIKGMQLPRLNSGVYETGVQTGIFSEFDLSFVQFINELYTVQDNKLQTNNSILSSMIAKDSPDDDRETRKLFATMQVNLNDIIAGEIDLQKFYCELLHFYFSKNKGGSDQYCPKEKIN